MKKITAEQAELMAKAKAVLIEEHPIPDALIIDDKLGEWFESISWQASEIVGIFWSDNQIYDSRLTNNEAALELCELYRDVAPPDLQYHLYNSHYQRPSEIGYSIGELIVRNLFFHYVSSIKSMRKNWDDMPYDYKKAKFKEVMDEFIKNNLS